MNLELRNKMKQWYGHSIDKTKQWWWDSVDKTEQ